MPSVSVRLTRSHVDDLIAVCRFGPGPLNALAEALRRMPPTIKRAELTRTIAETIGDAGLAEIVVRVLAGLAAAIRRYSITAPTLLDSIQASLSTQALSDEDSRAWHECRPIIEKLLNTETVILDAKARELAFDFDKLYARARILTDIRPVFDDTRNDIRGAAITQTLRLDYLTPEKSSPETISLAMDTADIEQLKKFCEDALRKGARTRELMEKLTIDVVMPGDKAQ